MSFKVSAQYKRDKIHLNFGKGVVPTGGTITILDKNNKKLESIKIGSPKISGDVYSLKSMLWDYSYNSIALDNYDIFSRLASHDKKKISDKRNKEWAFDLRMTWNVSIDGTIYRLDEDNYLSVDETYNYHETTPEYTPGASKSGNVNIVLSPLEGIKTLSIKPSKKAKKFSDSLKIDISDAGLMSASGNSTDYLDFEQPIKVSGESKDNVGGKESTKPGTAHIFNLIPIVLDRVKGWDEKGWKKNVEAITGNYALEKTNYQDGVWLDESKYTMSMYFDYDLDIKGAGQILGRQLNPIETSGSKKRMPFGDGEKAGKKNYKYYDDDGNVFVNLKASSKKYLERGTMEGDFTLTLSERKIFFEDDDGKNTMTAIFANDLL